MHTKTISRIIHEIGLLNYLPDETVRMIVSSQFEVVRNEMKNADPENGVTPDIRMINFGKFYVKPGRKFSLRGKERYREIQRQRRLKKYKTIV